MKVNGAKCYGIYRLRNLEDFELRPWSFLAELLNLKKWGLKVDLKDLRLISDVV